MSAVGLALVGAGPWGLTLGRAAARLPEVDLRWICELDPARRAGAGAAVPTARLTGSLDEALADPSVQAALVAVDSPRHHSVGLRVLKADRHLLVEKPMALTVAHAAELNALAGARRRLLSVDHLLLHHPAVQRARSLLVEGDLGDPLWIETARLAPGPGRPGGSAWWTLAPHDVSLVLHLFDAVPSAVTAVGGAHLAGDPEQDTLAWATLHFADGRLAHIHVGRRAPQKQRGFQLIGTRRALTFDELSPGQGLRVYDPARGDGASPEVVPVDPIDALVAQCQHFVRGVARNDTTAGNSDHALTVVRVLEAGARSMRNGGAPIALA